MDNETERRGYMPPSATTEWETPPELFDTLDREFGPFTCDPACLPSHYTAHQVLRRDGRICIPPGTPVPYIEDGPGIINYDGLTSSWSGRVFLNPPYGSAERACVEGCKKKRCVRRGHHITEDVPGVGDWVAKAVSEVEEGNVELVCALLKATTDVAWWQDYVFTEFVNPWDTCCQEPKPNDRTSRYHTLVKRVRFLPGRLHFGGDSGPAPFPSAVVVWQR